jgi:CyaY protein
MTVMDESAYLKLVDTTFRRVEDAFEDVDPDDAEINAGGDVLTITFKSGVRCVLNRQRAVRQIWLAARDRAWHFNWDGTRWLDDKGTGIDLFAQVRQIAREQASLDLPLA